MGPAVKMLKNWVRPAVAATLWILAVAFTLSELSKAAPLLHAARLERPLPARRVVTAGRAR
jgi:hypothetical protein